MARAGSDVGLMLIAYNLRRIGNILTQGVLKEYLRMLVSLFLAIFDLLRSILMISERRSCRIAALLSKKPAMA